MTLIEKHRKIKDWLESIYVDEDIVQYDINETTITHLYEMVVNNSTKDRDARLSTEDMRQKSEEYHAEAERLEGIMKRMGMDSHSLSQSGVTSLQTLARLAEILKLKYTSESCYLLALRRLDDDLCRVSCEWNLLQRGAHNLFDKNREFLLKSAKWKKALEDLETERRIQEPEMKSYKKTALFFQAKVKEYKRQERKHIECLRKLNVDPSEYHGALVSQSEELERLNETLQPLKKKLDSYNNLPPDITMTKVKIEEIKQQLHSMEIEVNRRINVIHM